MAAAIALLDWRTGQIAPGAEYATISGLWLEQAVTGPAFVEPLASIGRHNFALLVPAFRAGNGGFQFRIYHVARLVKD